MNTIKKETGLIKVIKSIIEPLKNIEVNTNPRPSSHQNVRPDHQPSWMYRNE